MYFRQGMCCLLFVISACSFTPEDTGMHADFTPPLTKKYWNVESYTLNNGLRVCSVSSGYNGITVTLSHPSGQEQVVVQSNRRMQPGAELTVTANGESFLAYDTFFPAKDGAPLLQSLLKGGKAYLEWSEFSGSSSRERIHVQNIAQLTGFADQVKECRTALDRS